MSRWVPMIVAFCLTPAAALADVGIELETEGSFEPGAEVSFSAVLANHGLEPRSVEVEVSAVGAGLRLERTEGPLECSAALPFAEALKTCRLSVEMEADSESRIQLRLAVPEEFVQREVRITAIVSAAGDSDRRNNLSVVRLKRSAASGSDVRLTLVEEAAGVLRVGLRNLGATPTESGRLKVRLKGEALHALAMEPLPGVECGAASGADAFCRSTPELGRIDPGDEVVVRIRVEAKRSARARAEYLSRNEVRPDDNAGVVEISGASRKSRATGRTDFAVFTPLAFGVGAVALIFVGMRKWRKP